MRSSCTGVAWLCAKIGVPETDATHAVSCFTMHILAVVNINHGIVDICSQSVKTPDTSTNIHVVDHASRMRKHVVATNLAVEVKPSMGPRVAPLWGPAAESLQPGVNWSHAAASSR